MSDSLEIKICGISTEAAIDALVAGGAAYMGLIFFERSPRHVSLEQASGLSSHAGSRVGKVAVTVDASDDYIGEIVTAVKPDMLQLHGSETPERAKQLDSRFGLPIMKSIAVGERSDLDKIAPYEGIVDRFLFDAKPPSGSNLPGGNGVAFEWEIMDGLPDNVPYMLSGGLDATNIQRAIRLSGATAVDVSSGVESAPGIKDPRLIEAFLKICREITPTKEVSFEQTS